MYSTKSNYLAGIHRCVVEHYFSYQSKHMLWVLKRPISDFIWPFLRPYMGVIPNPKMAFIFQISCILALIFPI